METATHLRAHILVYLFVFVAASREDKFVYHGEWSTDAPDENYLLIHVPKTSGSSFLQESPEHLPVGSTLTGNHEQTPCHRLTRIIPASRQAVLVRSPRKHVFSQFLECKYDKWGQRQTKGTGFPGFGRFETTGAGFEEWLAHFVNDSTASKGDYKCYNPWNLQTRFLACIGLQHGPPVSDPRVAVPVAVTMLDHIGFVGIADYYDASICAYEFFVAGTTRCTCKEGRLLHPDDYVQARITHRVPRHSLNDLTKVQTQLINKLTVLDDIVYTHALAKFRSFIKHIEKKSGVNLLCSSSTNILTNESHRPHQTA
eukprot:gene17659-21040_t